jgi:geranylgeranyl diphosphate synthase, type I
VAVSTRLVDLVQADIDSFLAERASQLSAIAPELDDFLAISRDLLTGGKRFRALFAYWGWRAVAGTVDGFDPLESDSSETDLGSVVRACAALEVFHAAALVHDDIMDNSDTRRGAPSVHKRFEALHSAGNWPGSAPAYGRSSALLLGDLLLGWSDELLDSGLGLLASLENARSTRAEFNRMRTEVTAGQYLDIYEESAWMSHPEVELLSRAHRVIVYKSAKYSVEEPLAIGAHLGGASAGQLEALREFGLPLGIAYQLRDDLLGVFGDPLVTGKPAGDDLREGKRTVLIALARKALPTPVRRLLDELLGDAELEDSQITVLQNAIRESGAVDQVERIIDRNVGKAREAIADAPIASSARMQLMALADSTSQRTA